MQNKFKLLCVIPPHFKNEGTIFFFPDLMKNIQGTLDNHISHRDTISSMDEYEALPEDSRKSYDIVLVQMGSIAPAILGDQVQINQNLKWVHSLSAGIDGYMGNPHFKASPVPLTNAKGAYSSVLGEFIALGVLFHTKHLERFMQRKAEKKWEIEPMELVSKKHIAFIGYGDIGTACAKVCKLGFGMKVTGLKRNPDSVTEEQKSYCDEVVGNDQYDRVISEADFVCGILPKVAGVTDDFFNEESTFSKMKKTSVFMNIGRGTTVNEDDLCKALKSEMIAGAVLDVYKNEPLAPDREIFECPNLLMTPHCADQDTEHLFRAAQTFADNLDNFASGGVEKLFNICDKEKGY